MEFAATYSLLYSSFGCIGTAKVFAVRVRGTTGRFFLKFFCLITGGYPLVLSKVLSRGEQNGGTPWTGQGVTPPHGAGYNCNVFQTLFNKESYLIVWFSLTESNFRVTANYLRRSSLFRVQELILLWLRPVNTL